MTAWRSETYHINKISTGALMTVAVSRDGRNLCLTTVAAAACTWWLHSQLLKYVPSICGQSLRSTTITQHHNPAFFGRTRSCNYQAHHGTTPTTHFNHHHTRGTHCVMANILNSIRHPLIHLYFHYFHTSFRTQATTIPQLLCYLVSFHHKLAIYHPLCHSCLCPIHYLIYLHFFYFLFM